MEFTVSNCCYLCVLASTVLQTDSKVERWQCRESKLTLPPTHQRMPAREHIPFIYVISGIYADKARLKNKYVGFRKTHFFSRMFVGFKPEPSCQERVCNTRRKKNAEKKRTDNGLTYLGGSCLGGRGVHLFSGDGFTQSSSLFSSSTTPKPCHSCFRFEAMDTDKPPPLEIKAFFFFVSSFRLLKLNNPRLAFSGSTTRRLACSNARLTTRLWMSDIAL